MIKRLFSTTSKPIINVTNTAWNKINHIIEKQNAYSFIFSATSGGCSGFNYNLKLLDETNFEKVFEKYTKGGKIKATLLENNNSKIFIDPLSEMFLLGTTIDYINEDFNNGIYESKFVFLPDKNFADACGCGISFTPKM